ncbi:MAG: FAD-dependent oxidoreductase [Coriobacteriia bacterium]
MQHDVSEKGTSLTRRAFLKTSAAGLGGAAIVGVLGSTSEAFAADAADAKTMAGTSNAGADPIASVGIPAKWTSEADIVIVGAGGAGLSAAVTAAEAGAKVIVLEKNAFAGGDSSIAMLFEGFVPSKWLKSLGLWGDELSNPKLIADRFTGMSATTVYGLADPKDPSLGLPVAALGPSIGVDYMGVQDAFNNIYTPTPICGRDSAYVRRIFSAQAETIDWLQEDMGVQFSTKQVAGLPIPGMMHCPIDPAHPEEDWEYWDPHNGRGFTEPLFDKAYKLGVTFYMSTPADGLVVDDTGRVVGVRGSYEGQDVFVKGKAVLLTVGGFAANRDMLFEYCTKDRAESARAWSGPWATGDGIRMAQALGAKTHMMEEIEIWDGGAMRELGSHAVYSAPNQLVRQKSLTVNNKGKRFFSEGQYRGYYFSYQSAQTIAQPNHESATLFDAECISREDIIKKFSPWVCEYPCNWFDSDFKKYLEEGVILKADTIEELAKLLGYPEDNLVATVNRYNELCEAGYDEDFFKDAQYLHPIKTAPFYAVKQIGGSCFNTWGGLVVDEEFRVVDEKLDPIPGLYSAGENVAGGASLAFCLPGGRLAAKAIVDAIKA